jgi:hypothetical protein
MFTPFLSNDEKGIDVPFIEFLILAKDDQECNSFAI